MSAIASGGLFGKGTGEDAFLKNIGAANTDLVFGVISEQFGLILALCTVFILLVLVLYATRCAATARSSYYVIAANSAAAVLVFQATLNVLGAVDILPLTGVTLPFVSVGGSSMISCWGLLAFEGGGHPAQCQLLPQSCPNASGVGFPGRGPDVR